MRPFRDPKLKERREARRFQFILCTVVGGAVVGVWLLYEHVAWIRALLGTSRGSVGLGILLLASPMILFMYLLEKSRK